MLVQELIDKLKEFDPNKPVFVLPPDENPIGGGSVIDDVFLVQGSNDESNNAVYLVEG